MKTVSEYDAIAETIRRYVEGSIATARLELDDWTGHKFTDMFTLLKTGG